jgi:hypothetical protein
MTKKSTISGKTTTKVTSQTTQFQPQTNIEEAKKQAKNSFKIKGKLKKQKRL